MAMPEMFQPGLPMGLPAENPMRAFNNPYRPLYLPPCAMRPQDTFARASNPGPIRQQDLTPIAPVTSAAAVVSAVPVTQAETSPEVKQEENKHSWPARIGIGAIKLASMVGGQIMGVWAANKWIHTENPILSVVVTMIAGALGGALTSAGCSTAEQKLEKGAVTDIKSIGKDAFMGAVGMYF